VFNNKNVLHGILWTTPSLRLIIPFCFLKQSRTLRLLISDPHRTSRLLTSDLHLSHGLPTLRLPDSPSLRLSDSPTIPHLFNDFRSPLIINKTSLQPLYTASKSSVEMIFLPRAIKIHATISISERKAILRKRLNSKLVCPVDPSAIFKHTESAARLIWDDKTYNSSFGNFEATSLTRTESSKDFCQLQVFRI
jgi:hypothetical protein